MKQFLISLSAFSLLLTIQVNTFAQAPPIIWQRCYGGDSTDKINCIRATVDGGYIATGSTRSSNGDLAANAGVKGLWVLKLDPFGNIQWEKTYSDTLFNGNYIEPTIDGGYILTTSDKIIKLYSDGSINWQVSQEGIRVHQTRDSGYILCNNYTFSPVLTKLRADGSTEWQQTSLESLGDQLFINDVCEAYDGGYIITGSIHDIFGSPFVAKTNSTGNIIVPPANPYTHGNGLYVCRTNDGKYALANFANHSDVLSKINDDCSTDWSDFVTGVAYLTMRDMNATNNYGAIVTGSDTAIMSNISIAVYDSAGHLLWNKLLGGSQIDAGTSGCQAANTNYAVAGYTTSNNGDVSGNHGGTDGWVVVFGTNTAVPVMSTAASDIRIYPQPANDVVQIALPKGYENALLQLQDMTGRTLQVPEDNNGLLRALHLGGMAAGTYIVKITSNGTCESRKIAHF